MRTSALLLLPCYAVLLGCQQPAEHPEVAYRHWMRDQAVKAAKIGKITYEQAAQFVQKCEGFAIEAAAARSRTELGAKFDPKSRETASHIRDNLQMIVTAHVCAFASEGDFKRCPPIL